MGWFQKLFAQTPTLSPELEAAKAKALQRCRATGQHSEFRAEGGGSAYAYSGGITTDGGRGIHWGVYGPDRSKVAHGIEAE